MTLKNKPGLADASVTRVNIVGCGSDISRVIFSTLLRKSNGDFLFQKKVLTVPCFEFRREEVLKCMAWQFITNF